ncbi:MAG: EF-P lysine aminoacylase EpmA [Thermodesulfobacteriota bacterium]|nr:EF-P lysine aminoacylase EpmA [Thermodesulfobacteriota bacterium]
MLTPRGLQQRSHLLQAVRSFFFSKSYLEVDTPIRLPVLIPEAEIIPIQSEDWFLQTSPELCMKRLLAGGCPQLFQICPCFRSGERGRLHQQEFTMLEWYHTGWSYVELMDECEEMVRAVTVQLAAEEDARADISIHRAGKEISFASPWQRMTVQDAFQQYGGMSAGEAADKGKFDEILVERVEPNLGWQRPVFLYDYPISLASLARQKDENPEVAERFELYIGGVELANGFSELTDPEVQRQRFAHEIGSAGNGTTQQPMPEKFLQALADLPDCAGIALGLDRLLMLVVGAQTIADVLPFSERDL